MDRREFAALMPALLACGALMPEQAGAQTLPILESGHLQAGATEVRIASRSEYRSRTRRGC